MAAAGAVGAGVAAHAAISALKSAQRRVQDQREEA
jgi:hydrogenase small subunit